MNYYQTCAIPKPTPRKRVKGRKERREAAVKTSVRAQTVERDGHCIIASRFPRGYVALLGVCQGPSQWAHVGRHRRCFTRGMTPEQRHTTAGSCQMCEKHHTAYDAHAFDFVTGIQGMDGIIGIRRRAA